MMKRYGWLTGIAALCVALSFNAGAKLYKWVDENGTTHYGETIPPQYANHNVKELEKGRVGEREASRDKPGQQPAALSREAELAKRRDNALLNTYSSEKEIDLARERNLQQVEARLDSFSTMLKSARENMAGLQQERESFIQQKRQIPTGLEEDLAEAQQRIDKLETDLKYSQQEMATVKSRYEADKVRYRELKGQSAAKPE